MITITICNNW